MKSTKLIALVLTVGLMQGVPAQNFTTIEEALQNEELEISNTNVDERGKRIRGSYLTNPWYSNWSIALMGGAQTLVSGTKEHNTGFDLNTARNTFWGYRANRFYNIIPYAQFGMIRLCHPDYPLFSTGHRDRDFEIGVGLFNTFRITDALQDVVDLRWGNVDGRYHDVREGERVHHFTAQVGIAYNIEKWYFTRAKFIKEQRDVPRQML